MTKNILSLIRTGVFYTVVFTFLGCLFSFCGYQVGWLKSAQDALFVIFLSYFFAPPLAVYCVRQLGSGEIQN